jgi:hypothetical protein
VDDLDSGIDDNSLYKSLSHGESKLTMLGSPDALTWHQQGDDLVMDLPDSPEVIIQRLM